MFYIAPQILIKALFVSVQWFFSGSWPLKLCDNTSKSHSSQSYQWNQQQFENEYVMGDNKRLLQSPHYLINFKGIGCSSKIGGQVVYKKIIYGFQTALRGTGVSRITGDLQWDTMGNVSVWWGAVTLSSQLSSIDWIVNLKTCIQLKLRRKNYGDFNSRVDK